MSDNFQANIFGMNLTGEPSRAMYEYDANLRGTVGGDEPDKIAHRADVYAHTHGMCVRAIICAKR